MTDFHACSAIFPDVRKRMVTSLPLDQFTILEFSEVWEAYSWICNFSTLQPQLSAQHPMSDSPPGLAFKYKGKQFMLNWLGYSACTEKVKERLVQLDSSQSHEDFSFESGGVKYDGDNWNALQILAANLYDQTKNTSTGAKLVILTIREAGDS